MKRCTITCMMANAKIVPNVMGVARHKIEVSYLFGLLKIHLHEYDVAERK